MIKKLLFFLFIPSICFGADVTKTVYNPHTGRLDYILKSSSLSAGSLLDISTAGANNNDVLTFNSATGKFEPQAGSGAGITPGATYYLEKDTTTGVNYDLSKSTLTVSSGTFNVITSSVATISTATILNLSVEQSANLHNTVTFSSNVIINSTANINLDLSGQSGYFQIVATGTLYGLWVNTQRTLANSAYRSGAAVGINYQNLGSFGSLTRMPLVVNTPNDTANYVLGNRRSLLAHITSAGNTIDPEILIGHGTSVSYLNHLSIGHTNSDHPSYANCSFFQSVGTTSGDPYLIFFTTSGTTGETKQDAMMSIVPTKDYSSAVMIGRVVTSTHIPPSYPENLIIEKGFSGGNYFKLGNQPWISTSDITSFGYTILRPTATIGTNDTAVQSSGVATTWQAMNNSIADACVATAPVGTQAIRPIYFNFRVESASVTYPIQGVSICIMFKSTFGSGTQKKLILQYSSSTTGQIYQSTQVASYSAYATFTDVIYTSTRNPFTGRSWTWEQINTGYWGGAFWNTGGTSGQMMQIKNFRVEVYYSSTSQIIYDNNKMGIGEGNPQATLDVRGLGNPNSPNPYLLVLATSADITSARETINSVGEHLIVATSIQYTMNGSTYAQTHVAREMAISSYSQTTIATMTLTIPDAVFHGRSIRLIITSSGSSIACSPILRFNGETGATLTYNWRGSSDTVETSSLSATGLSLLVTPTATTLRSLDITADIQNNVSTNGKNIYWIGQYSNNNLPVRLNSAGWFNNNTQITSFSLSNPQGATFNGLTMFVEVINP